LDIDSADMTLETWDYLFCDGAYDASKMPVE
jgi:hypothetical protein